MKPNDAQYKIAFHFFFSSFCSLLPISIYLKCLSIRNNDDGDKWYLNKNYHNQTSIKKNYVEKPKSKIFPE